MSAHNIIDLGFSEDVVKEKGKILEALNEVYQSAKKIDGLRIEIKMSNSIKDFKAVTKDLETQYQRLTETIKNYNQVLEDHYKQQQKTAEAQKKEAQAAADAAQAKVQTAKSVGEVNAAYGSMLGNIEGSLVALRKLKGALNENQVAQRSLAKDYQAGNITLDQYNASLLQLEKQEKLLGQAIKQQNLYITSQTKELIAAEDSYDQLNAKMLQLERTWKALKKTDRESEIGVNLQKEVAAARAELTKMDETIGNHQRKVGNYALAWNGLGNSVSQLTRELPAFANSLQTGFMGISNNIPILADEIKRIRVENAALKAEGKPTTSVLKQLGSAFFSWNTALSLGITLLVVYGKEVGELITSLIKGKQAIDEAKLSQEAFSKALESTDYKSAVANVAELTDKIELAKKGFIDKKQVLQEYNSTIGKTTGKVTDLESAESQLVKNKDVYIEMMAQKAAATYAYQQYAEKTVEAQKKITDGPGIKGYIKMIGAFLGSNQNLNEMAKAGVEAVVEGYNEDTKAALGYKDIATKIMKDIASTAKQNKWTPFGSADDKTAKQQSILAKKMLEAQKKSNEAQLQQQAALNKSLADLDSIGYAARQGFLKKYYAIEQQIIADNAKYDLQQAGLTEEQKVAIKEEAAKKSLDLTVKFNSENAKLQQKADADFKAQYEKDLEEMKSFEQKHGKELQILKFKQRDDDAKLELENGQSRLQDLTTQYNNEQAALTESLNKKEISQTEYAQRMIKLQREYTAEAIKLQIAAAEAAAKLTTDPKEFLELQNKISSLRKSYQDFVKESDENPMPKWQIWAQKMLPYVERVAEALNNLASTMQSIGDIDYNNQKAELDELAQKADDNYSKEQENIANSTLSEAEKANKLKVLEAQHDAQKQQIEKRQKQADNERAQFNKQISIINIISSTAEAIMKTLAQGGWFALPLTYTIGAMGAAELAAVVATKVPQYAEGTDDHPGGPAIVGEGKHRELVITPDGKIGMATKPMLMDLPTHTQVIPITPEFLSREKDYQFAQLMELAKIKKPDYMEIAPWQLKQLAQAYKDANQSRGKRIQVNNINIDLGWAKYVQRNTRGIDD